MKRILAIGDLSKKDSYVSGGLLRFKNGAFVIDSSSIEFDASDPLLGWTAPLNPKENSTAIVIFKRGISYYTFLSGTWTLLKYDTDYYVPIKINTNEEYLVAENTQVLYHQMLDVDGMLTVDGMLIDVGEVTEEGSENCWWGQVVYVPAYQPEILLFQENEDGGDVNTWQRFDVTWQNVQTGGTSFDWSLEGAGLYRVRQQRAGYCPKYSNIVETYNI
jgi:hypothetical protein